MSNSFVYWLTDVSYKHLTRSPYDLIVVETGVTSVWGATFTPRQLRLLQQNRTPDDLSDDRPVLGYVNIAVTDHNRTYWNPQWVTPTDPDNADVGAVDPGAPAWLAAPLGEARGPVTATDAPAPDNPTETIYGPIADFVNESPNPDGTWPEGSWHDIVIEQAVAVVQAGYSGVFLDDVSRYYLDGGPANGTDLADRAEAMMAFVNDVADAVHAVDPDALVYINGDAYITYNNVGVTSEETAFLGNVDGILLENLFTTAPYALDVAATVWAGHGDVLSVEWQDTLQAPGAWYAFAQSRGILTHLPDDAGYDEYTPLPTSTPPAEYQVILGTWQGEVITGTQGDDLIFGLGGDDTVDALGGDDTIVTWDGNDLITAGDGHDLVLAGLGNDTLRGGRGRDTLFGQDGADELRGHNGADLLVGGLAADLLRTGSGADIWYQGDAPQEVIPPDALLWL